MRIFFPACRPNFCVILIQKKGLSVGGSKRRDVPLPIHSARCIYNLEHSATSPGRYLSLPLLSSFPRSLRSEVEASVSPTDLIDFQSHPRGAINFRQVAALNRGASGTRNDKSAGSGGEQNNQRFRMKREFYLTAEMRRAALARRCSAANTRAGQISFEIEITFRSFACYNLALPSSCLINVYTVSVLYKLPRRPRD